MSTRYRSANFSSVEKIALFKIIDKYKQILENKKTDGVSNKEKDEAWNKVTAEFNSANSEVTARSKESIKRFFENKKKELRKQVANERMNIKGTGGGPPVGEVTNKSDELLLSIINKKTVYGLNSNVGGDVESEEENELSSVPIIYEYLQENQTNNTDDYIISEPVGVATENEEVTLNTTWDKYKGADLQQPISTPLKRKRPEPTDKTCERSKLGNSRRRPAVTVKALTSSDVASKYNILLDRRLELIEISKEKAQQEITRNAEKHGKEMAFLDLQMEVEQEKLKRIKNSSYLN